MEQFFAAEGPLQIPFGIDFFAVAVGVITGAIFACDRKLDIVGTVVLALITAFGGGIIRDLLLQNHGVYFMQYPEVILICMGIAVFVFCFRGWFKHTGQVLFFADALSVALFALAGANKAFQCGEGVIMVVILGAITSVGGGALRDVAVGETPSIFQRSNFYAVAGLAGSLVFALMAFAKAPLPLAAVACVFSVVFLRYLSVYYDWKTSDDTDFAPKVDRGIRRVWDFFAGLFRHATLQYGGSPRKVTLFRKKTRKKRSAGQTESSQAQSGEVQNAQIQNVQAQGGEVRSDQPKSDQPTGGEVQDSQRQGGEAGSGR